ncbi:MAG: nucleotidyltransferase domain-containing protein [Acidobacteriota bacterium]
MTQEQLRNLLAELKTGLAALYGERMRAMYLYGSYARGEADPDSDVDLLIVLDRIGSYWGELKRSGPLASSLSLNYGSTVSLVFVSQRDWATRETPFLDNVREEAIAA